MSKVAQSLNKSERYGEPDKTGGTSLRVHPERRRGSTIPMKTMTYSWHESFMTAVIETDWTRMQARVQAAESEINERRRLLSKTHGGTLEERQAIEEALNCLQILRERCSFVAKLAAPLRFAGL
jgi:hypothetical protein